jgi:hypothetical protein
MSSIRVIRSSRLPGLLLPCLLLLFACASDDDEAIELLPTPPSSGGNSTVTSPANQTAETSPQPTTEGTEPAPAQPVAPSPVPTAVPLAIERPVAGSRMLAGDRVSINGRAQPHGDDGIALAIEIENLEVFTENAELDAAGYWGGVFTVPESVTGPAVLFATSAIGEQTSVPIEIVANEQAEGPSLTLERPAPGDVMVAGYIVFFEGLVRQPVDQALTFSVLTEGCITVAASFELSIPGGDWWGHLFLPSNSAVGPACAVVSTGQRTAGDGSWREVRIPVTLLDAADPAATSLYLGVPGDLIFQAGESIRLYGGAINAPDDEVYLVLTKDAVGPGALLAEETVSVDSFGYWEVELPSTRSWLGSTLLTISMGTEDAYTELRTTVEFER